MTTGPSWAELKAAARTTPEKIRLELQMLPYIGNKYSKFVDLIERAILFSLGEMVAAKNIINKDQSEDALTYMLSAPLRGMCFDVRHSTNKGGHCDIVIEGDEEMLWLGEAKKYSDYGKLMGGYQQLVDRYSPGLTLQLCGGIIIYTFDRGVATMMANWQKYLKDTREGLEARDIEGQPLQFLTIEPHAATEQSLTVRHYAIPLYHNPTDPDPPPRRPK